MPRFMFFLLRLTFFDLPHLLSCDNIVHFTLLLCIYCMVINFWLLCASSYWCVMYVCIYVSHSWMCECVIGVLLCIYACGDPRSMSSVHVVPFAL